MPKMLKDIDSLEPKACTASAAGLSDLQFPQKFKYESSASKWNIYDSTQLKMHNWIFVESLFEQVATQTVS